MVDLGLELQITPALLEFNRLAGRFTNFRPVIGGRLDRAVREFLRRRFESEGAVGGGGGWQQLSPSYASFKRIRGGKRKILQYSGEMMEAFTARRDVTPHQILILDRNLYSLTVDEEIAPRARGHQRGYSPAQPNLPRREIIPPDFPQDFIDKLKDIVRSYVVRGEQ